MYALLTTDCHAAEPQDTFYNLPRASHITIDGNLDDWEGKGFFIEQLALDRPNCETKDHAAWARIAWDREQLLLAVRVWDDSLLSNCETGLGAIASSEGSDSIVVQFRPLTCDVAPQSYRFGLPTTINDGSENPETAGPVQASFSAFEALDGGYGFEATFPWTDLGVQPQKGLKIDFQLSVNDLDPNEPCDCMSWRLLNTQAKGQIPAAKLRISTRASDPCGLCVWEQTDENGNVQITLQVPDHHDGDKVSIMKGDTVLAESIFTALPDELLAEAQLELSQAQYEADSENLAIAIGEESRIRYSPTHAAKP